MSNKPNHQFTIAEALQNLMGDKRINKGITESAIKEKWEGMMGKIIAQHTSTMYLKGTELVLYFNSSIIKNEFIYNREKVVSLINDEMGYNAITDIVIK
jgi:hypothetical protein